MGLSSDVLLDGRFAACSAFGATGTPTAVLIEDGRVASPVAIGGPTSWR